MINWVELVFEIFCVIVLRRVTIVILVVWFVVVCWCALSDAPSTECSGTFQWFGYLVNLLEGCLVVDGLIRAVFSLGTVVLLHLSVVHKALQCVFVF